MAKYNKQIAESTNTTMIHVSLDREDSAAEDWAAKAGLPWFTVLPGDDKKSGLNKYKTTRSVPEYHLVDKNGESLAKGAAACFAKIKELSK